MNKEYSAVVTKNYRMEFSEFLEAAAGDEVEMGEEYTKHPDWKNWVWDRHLRTGLSGWIPGPRLTFQSKQKPVFNLPYSSAELNATEGETLLVMKELNGWAWCKNKNGQEGWIPLENLKRL
ncbi:MAG: SH3 domain-containing protein [Candidatus Saccharicenans sp.]